MPCPPVDSRMACIDSLHLYYMITNYMSLCVASFLALSFSFCVYIPESCKGNSRSVTYYLCTHEENEDVSHEIKNIVQQHVTSPLFSIFIPIFGNIFFNLLIFISFLFSKKSTRVYFWKTTLKGEAKDNY